MPRKEAMYFQKRHATIDELELLYQDCNKVTQDYIDALAHRLYKRAKSKGHSQVSPNGAREIILRLIACTNGAILE